MTDALAAYFARLLFAAPLLYIAFTLALDPRGCVAIMNDCSAALWRFESRLRQHPFAPHSPHPASFTDTPLTRLFLRSAGTLLALFAVLYLANLLR